MSYSPYPPDASGSPADGAYGSPAGDILAAGPQRRRSAPPWVAASLAALAVVGVGGGVAYGGPALVRLLGGGSQPEDVLPAGAIAYAELDFEPSAGQKAGAARFLRKFPGLGDRLGEDEDPRRALWELLARDEEDLASVDYSRDLEPWLGKRAGVAVLAPQPGGEEPEVALALEVRDEERARQGLATLVERVSDADEPGFVVQDGYAVVAEDEAAARRVAAAGQERSLAEDPAYAADAGALGNSGISAGWVSLDRVRDALAALEREVPASDVELLQESLRGRVAWAMRFDGDDLELVAEGHGVPDTEPYAAGGGLELGELPASTVGAVGLANGDEVVARFWDRMVRQVQAVDPSGEVQGQVERFEREYGLALPEDLGALLGDSFVLAVDGEGLADSPRVGARVRTDAARAEEVLGKLEAAARDGGEELAVERKRVDGGIALGSDLGYVDLLAGGGDLGQAPAFRAALPDLGSADLAGYADLDRLADAVTGGEPGPGEERAVYDGLRAVDAVGMTVASDGDGEVRFRLKVVTR